MIVIDSTSTYVMDHIWKDQTGRVHSLYRSTINLIKDDTLLALHTQEKLLTPLSVRISCNQEELTALEIGREDFFLIKNNSILICSNRYPYRVKLYTNLTDTTSVYDSKIDSAKQDFDPDRIQLWAAIVLKSSQVNGLNSLLANPIPGDPILHVFAGREQLIKQAVLIKDWSSVSENLTDLIGLGIGLTPSGDDFLCGLLAGFLYTHASSHDFFQILREKILLSLRNTNDISAQFLKSSLQGHFSYTLLNFIYLVESNMKFDCLTIQELSSEFEKIGHSSGMDSLYGLYWYFAYIYPALQ